MKEERKGILLTIFKGMIVGTGAILPGVSGGVLCVAFGIYEPLMEILSDPIHKYRKHLKLLIPFLIGWLLGFFLLAKLLEVLFLKYETVATVFFASAILGTIPGLMKQIDPIKKSIAPVLLWTVLFIVIFLALDRSTGLNIQPNLFWYIFSGAVWGLSLIVPGLSSSSILILLGLYQKITAAIASFDLKVLLPLLLGLLVTVLSLAKLVHSLFDRHRDPMLCFISGIMIASAICMLVKLEYTASQILLCIPVFLIGFMISMRFDK